MNSFHISVTRRKLLSYSFVIVQITYIFQYSLKTCFEYLKSKIHKNKMKIYRGHQAHSLQIDYFLFLSVHLLFLSQKHFHFSFIFIYFVFLLWELQRRYKIYLTIFAILFRFFCFFHWWTCIHFSVYIMYSNSFVPHWYSRYRRKCISCCFCFNSRNSIKTIEAQIQKKKTNLQKRKDPSDKKVIGELPLLLESFIRVKHHKTDTKY